ncbi:MAG: IS66 family transposase zinc-finger binding domain-containing protein [Rubripirellula sp.]
MNAKDLRAENERLKMLLAEVQHELAHSRTQLTQANDELQHTQSQHEAVASQFTQTLEEKQHQVASLEHQIKLLLQRIRGSRQERIDPDQLLLFSLKELQEIAEQLEQRPAEGDLIDDTPRRRRKSRGRRGKLPAHLPRELIRHELSASERACPGCGVLRQEIGVESSEQLELIPARLKVLQHDRVKYACRACVRSTLPSPTSRHNQSKRACPLPACVLTRYSASSATINRCTDKKTFTRGWA